MIRGVRCALRTWTGLPDVPAARRWAWVAVVDSLGTGMLLPVTVIYFTVVVGLPAPSVGVGLGIAGLLGMIGSPLSGVLVDRLGARVMVITWFAVAAAGYFSYTLVDGWVTFVLATSVAQIADHAAKPAKQAFVASIVGAEHRVALMAFQRAVRNIGYAAGGLVTAALLTFADRAGYTVVLLANAVSYLAAAALVLGIPVLASARPGPRSVPDPAPRMGYRQVLADRRYVAVAVLNTLVLTHATAFTIGVPLWVTQRTDAPTGVVGVLFTVNTVLVVVLQVRMAQGVTSVRGTPPVYLRAATAFTVAALAYWLASVVGDLLVVVVLVLLLGVVTHTVAELYAAVGEWTVSINLAPDHLRGRYLSLFALSSSAHQALGPAVVTVLIAAVPGVAWFALAALLAVGCLATARLVRDAAEPTAAEPTAVGAAGDDVATVPRPRSPEQEGRTDS
jgi:MFS family permease